MTHQATIRYRVILNVYFLVKEHNLKSIIITTYDILQNYKDNKKNDGWQDFMERERGMNMLSANF